MNVEQVSRQIEVRLCRLAFTDWTNDPSRCPKRQEERAMLGANERVFQVGSIPQRAISASTWGRDCIS